MKALIISHDPGSTSAMVGQRLEHHGYSLHNFLIAESTANPNVEVDFPELDEYDLIVPMGAIWSVYDNRIVGNWINDEMLLLTEADRRGIPVLGICFGAQVLAQTHGGNVVKSAIEQVGWYTLPEPAEPNIAAGPWFEWHYDRFDPPADAEVLAKDEMGVQVFRLRRNLAVQFHPEVTVEHITMWLEEDDGAGYAELASRGISADELLDETQVNTELARPNTNQLVDWFLADVAVTGVKA